MKRRSNFWLTSSAYTLAFLLVVVPISEVLVRVWPLAFSKVPWRFAAAGILSNGLIMPLLGVALAVAVAYLGGHSRTLRLAAVVSMAAGLLVLTISAGFVLDLLQTRAQVNKVARTAIAVAGVHALLKMWACSALCIMIAAGSWKGAREVSAASKALSPTTPTTVILHGESR